MFYFEIQLNHIDFAFLSLHVNPLSPKVKSSGVRQGKIYKSLLGRKGLREIGF